MLHIKSYRGWISKRILLKSKLAVHKSGYISVIHLFKLLLNANEMKEPVLGFFVVKLSLKFENCPVKQGNCPVSLPPKGGYNTLKHSFYNSR